MKLLAALLLCASQSWAICASGTLAYYNFNSQSGVDSCGGYNLTTVGSISYQNNLSCPDGSYAPNSFTAANYYNLPTGLINALTGTSEITIEFYTYKVQRVANSYFMKSDHSAGAVADFLLQYGDGVSDNIRVVTNGGTLTWADTSGVGVCRQVAYVGASGYQRLYVGDNGATPTLVSSTAQDGRLTTFPSDAWHIGTFLTVATEFRGSIDNLRFSNVARTSFPTVDPTSVRGTRSPYWENSIRPNLMKPLLPSLP